MGMDASAHIFFGIICHDESSLPWREDKWDDIEDWWMYETGYSDMGPWDQDGERIPGTTQEQVDEWLKKRRDHKKKNLPPIEHVHLYEDDCGAMLAVRTSYHYASWESPEEIKPEELKAGEPELKAFREFIEKYVPDMKNEPLKWYLVADYG